MTDVSGETCGVAGHDPECLCDVVIVTPTPINVDGVYGMWLGEQLCELRGHGSKPEWDGEQMADYFEDLLKVHDAWVYQQEPLKDPDHYKGGNKRWGWIRSSIREALRREPRISITQALDEISVSAEEFTKAVFTNKASLDADQLLRFEELVIGQQHTIAEIGRLLGLSRFSVKTLYSYWFDALPPVSRSQRNSRAPHVLAMVDMIREGKSNRFIVDEIQAKFGVTVTRSAVAHKRTRLEKSNGN